MSHVCHIGRGDCTRLRSGESDNRDWKNLTLDKTAHVIGILSPSEIEAVLSQNRVGRLAMCAGAFPYVVPVSYVYDGRVVYGYSGPGQKIEMMRSQPKVALLVDDIQSHGQWESVLVEGTFEEVTDPVERMYASAVLNGLSDQMITRGIAAEPGLVLYRVVPTRKSGRFEIGSH